MKDTLDPIDAPEVEPEEVNPWVDIWLSPRVTIEWVLKNGSAWVPWVLIYLGGVHYGIEQAMVKSAGDSKEVADILKSAFLVSGVGGLFTYTIIIGAIEFCSTWFGGRDNFKATSSAFGWAMVPAVLSLLLALVAYLIFGDDLFKGYKSSIEDDPVLSILYWIYWGLNLLLRFWYLGVLFAMIAQVQQFSIWHSIATIVCAALLIIVPLIAFVLLAGGYFQINI